MAVYHVALASCVVIALSINILAAPSVSKQKLNEARVTEHVKRVSKFRCSKPQPRLIPVARLLNSTLPPDVSYLPPATVLHQCDASSGCCFNEMGLTCGPKNYTDVELVFLVRNDVPGHGSQEKVYVTVVARNHTACACKDVSSGGRPK